MYTKNQKKQQTNKQTKNNQLNAPRLTLPYESHNFISLE